MHPRGLEVENSGLKMRCPRPRSGDKKEETLVNGKDDFGLEAKEATISRLKDAESEESEVYMRSSP